jgi:hypothetical protein
MCRLQCWKVRRPWRSGGRGLDGAEEMSALNLSLEKLKAAKEDDELFPIVGPFSAGSPK